MCLGEAWGGGEEVNMLRQPDDVERKLSPIQGQLNKVSRMTWN